MTFEGTFNIRKDNRLVIKLPDKFRTRKKVKVIIEDIDESRKEKIRMLEKASNDPLFLSDIEEITTDFKHSDKEMP
ncbi:MAG: hypothetical protein K9G67_05635 [Bacteroidales bacterium]|nr:hypothetical protein [Bacteroidales bacterium]MCF8343581.1 hypothetical protein [Bacteroidales bacterium]MCF8350239.1 hypothetical protein [Bacteroidales bacterium]MCF8375816.1 hypothetical protein [Bacteroidales bacterium]MCF8401742.1 hypothetical protein [Bacteroidales bacterium]